MSQKNSRFYFPIRIIAFILAITFIAQDISWAHPDSFANNNSPNNKLAPPLFSLEKESPDRVLVKIIESAIDRKLALLKHKPTLKDAALVFLSYRKMIFPKIKLVT